MAAVTIQPKDQSLLAMLPGAALAPEQRGLLAAARLLKVQVFAARREVLLTVETPRRLDQGERQHLAAAVSAALLPGEAGVTVNLALRLAAGAGGTPAAVQAAWPDSLREAGRRMPKLSALLQGARQRVDGGRVVVEFAAEAHREIAEKSGAATLLEQVLAEEAGWTGGVSLSAPGPLPHPADDGLPAVLASLPPEPHPGDEHLEEYFARFLAETARERRDSKGREREASEHGPLRGRPIPPDAQPREVKSVTEEENRVLIEGEVVAPEARELKTGRVLISFGVCDLLRQAQPGDLGDTLPCKLFREKDDLPVEDLLKTGTWVRARGNVQLDRFSQELTLLVDDLQLGTCPARQDDHDGPRRVELHLHTIYSGMDGMIDPEEAVRRAVSWGHRGVAITDHGVVQAFPFAAHAKVPPDFKLIFGCELYVVDDGTPVITVAPAGVDLGEAEFVVLDLETTGFSPIGDDIIEIGAVRLKGGYVGESFQTFVRPSKPIPPDVQRLTNITPDQVAEAPGPAEALDRFFDFCQGAILVAHNASFDYSFLRYHRQRHLGQDLPNPVLDTLIMARSLLPGLKRHDLASLCRELDLPLDNHHRADSDARTTAALLLRLLNLGREQFPAVTQVDQLNQFTRALNVEQLRPHHCTVLVSRQCGIKHLYQLISASHLEYFNRTPRVPRTLLAARREGFLVGSACEQGALFQALLRGATEEELEELAGWYDYLEIQPRENLGHLVDEGQVSSAEHLLELNRRIYALGRRLGKPVVATGDAHFVDPHQQNFRRILKGGKGFWDEGDAPLYFRTTAEMLAEFAYLGEEAAHEVVVANTNLLADQVEPGIRCVPNALYTPKLEGADEKTRELAIARARQAYGDPLPQLVARRLDEELAAIIGNQFAVIYYIAHLLVRRSNELGYLVGSRGSVGSSLVAWCMGITEVNALPPHYVCPDCHHVEWFNDGSVGSGFDLPDKGCPACGRERLKKDGQDIPFETFLGLGGDKVPDIDLNFSGEIQGKIQKFTEELLGGAKQVFKAGTVGTIAEKTAFGMVRGWLEENNLPTVRTAHVEYLARGVAGVKRTTGQHPGGMVVVPVGMEVEEVTPVQFPADDRSSGVRTTHFDYHSFESCLLKLDILGHDDPTSLRMLQDLTGQNVTEIPMDDPQVLALFRPGEALGPLGVKPGEVEYDLGTIAVPEFGTGFVRRMLLETLPRTFSDLVRISGLSHGTDVWTNNAQELIRQGLCTLQTVIPTRDDIMVRLMYWGLEPATAFKIMESVRKGRGLTAEMEEAMRARGVPDWYIWSCKQIKYMFPKAHAVAYCMSSVRIAWFKVHHPREYYATYFTVRAGALDADLVCRGSAAVRRYTDEIKAKGREATQKEKDALTELELVDEAFKRGVAFRRVDLYRSDALRFQIEDDGALLCPFNSLPGLGENAAEAIVLARTDGPFVSVEDLRNRARLNKTVIELLQNHGTLAGMPENNQLVFRF